MAKATRDDRFLRWSSHGKDDVLQVCEARIDSCILISGIVDNYSTRDEKELSRIKKELKQV